MIGWLSGRIMDRQRPGHLVLDVNGVGYDVETSLQTFFHLESQTSEGVGLHIHTVVREDAIILFGFLEKTERSLFRTLIKVNGVGPKMAMGILSNISPSEFIQSIHQNDLLRLTKVPGVGKKTAERLLIDMKDALKHVGIMEEGTMTPTVIKSSVRQEVQEAISALESLGYKHHEALTTLKKIDSQHMSCEELIRLALKHLYIPN